MNEDPAHFVRKPVWIHPQMGGGGGVYVKYWPSGGWALAYTGALTRENTVIPISVVKLELAMHVSSDL